MTTLALSDILDDLRVSEEGLHKFERRYWISSEHFYDLYSRGLLDDGENDQDFAEWAGHYRLWQKRQDALKQLSRQRLEMLQHQANSDAVVLTPAEPVVKVG